MKRIRALVFETNSSSVNSLAVFTDDAFKKYQQDNMYVFDPFYHDGVITSEDVLSREEAIKRMREEAAKYGEISEDDLDEALRDWEYISLENIKENDYLDSDTKYVTSPSGDSMVILSQYGYDG